MLCPQHDYAIQRVDVRSLRSVRNDNGGHKAGAVGLARSDGQQTGAGAGDLTSAVVGVASTLLEASGQGGGGERQNNGGLHLDCLELRRYVDNGERGL